MLRKINDIFKNRVGNLIGEYNKAAVLIPLYREEEEIFVLFEKRSLTLRRQPGDICFPGGRLEEGESPRDCCIRESVEELNLEFKDIDVIGEMDYLITNGGLIIYVFVGEIKKFPNNPSKDEVHSIVKIPLSFFLESNPKLYEMEVGPYLKDNFPYDLIIGGKSYKFSKTKVPQYFYKYNNHIIWGSTARITKEFINLIKSGT